MSDDEGAEPVEPTNKDVLFGRGGMTKHHKGNAWFRSLMKENRLLYLESPKHHKLQLVEQIVDYILSKNCRFLQKKHATHKHWFPVSYKRAVVKTSQAFRDAHRYDKTLKPEHQQRDGVSELPSLANMDPVTLQKHLIQRSLELYQPQQVAAPVAPAQRSVVLIPPPSDSGEEEVHPPRVILSKPKRPAAEFYKKKKSPEAYQQETASLVQSAAAPTMEHSVARRMVALFELAARDKEVEEFAVYSARFHAAAEASASAVLCSQQPSASSLVSAPRVPERVIRVDKYLAQQQYDHEASSKLKPLAASTPLKNWAALNKVLDRRTMELKDEDDQFADADEEDLFPTAACAS